MRIAIAVHSRSGVSLELARAVGDAARAGGHEAVVTRLEPAGEASPHQQGVLLRAVPDVSGFDALVTGGPIWAFCMSPVVLSFAGSLGDMSGKVAVPFATMGFPFRFMGGLHGIAQLRQLLEQTGAKVGRGVITNRMLHDPGRQRAAAVAGIMEQAGLAGVGRQAGSG